MLTVFRVAELIFKGQISKKYKSSLGDINAENEYHKIKKDYIEFF